MAQVRNLQVVSEQIVAVQFDCRIQVKYQGGEANGRGPIEDAIERVAFHGHSPEHCEQRPEKQLEEYSGEHHDEALALIREEIGIGQIAVERRLEVDQQKSHLVYGPAVALAGECVSILVNCR